MLVLKGENGKSRMIDIILDAMNSICFAYNDYPLHFKDCIWFNSKIYQLEALKLGIFQEVNLYQKGDYDCLIIYTNENESDLKDFIDWLKMTFTYRNIIVACK